MPRYTPYHATPLPRYTPYCATPLATLHPTQTLTTLHLTQTLLKRELSPAGLGAAALAFEVTPTQRALRSSADLSLASFVEIQAQAISRNLRAALRAADWRGCPPPRAVGGFVDALLARLRSLQSLAAQVRRGQGCGGARGAEGLGG